MGFCLTSSGLGGRWEQVLWWRCSWVRSGTPASAKLAGIEEQDKRNTVTKNNIFCFFFKLLFNFLDETLAAWFNWQRSGFVSRLLKVSKILEHSWSWSALSSSSILDGLTGGRWHRSRAWTCPRSSRSASKTSFCSDGPTLSSSHSNVWCQTFQRKMLPSF